MYKFESLPVRAGWLFADRRVLYLCKVIAFNIMTAMVLLLFIEIAVRLFYPEIKPMGTDGSLLAQQVYKDSEGLKPHAVGLSCGVKFCVDKNGFWKYHASFDSTKPSWLWLGDSVTMGMGVEPDSTFAGRCAAAIDSFNILNAALIGYTSTDYRNVTEALLSDQPEHGKAPLRIKRITLFWCLNDVYAGMEVSGVPGQTLREVSGGLLKFLKLHFFTYQWLKATFFDRSRAHYLYDRNFYENGGPHWQAALHDLKQIAAFARKNDLFFEVVLLPYEYQLRPAHVDELPQQIMQAELRNLNIPVYDAAGFLRAQEASAKLYRYGDGIHFSPRGHAALAQYMIETLAR